MGRLHALDYIVIAAAIAISASIGLVYACFKNKTPHEYLLAGGKTSILPVSLSLVASFMSSVSLLGNPSEIYYYGKDFFFYQVGVTFSLLIIAYLHVPLFHPLKLTSLNEYVYLRYRSRRLVYVSTVVQTLTYCVLNGPAMYAASIALESLMDVPVWINLILLGFVSTLYTAVGGYGAVIWSDAFQAVIMISSLLLVSCLGTYVIGGVEDVWELYNSERSLNWNISPLERTSTWTVQLYFCMLFTYLMGNSQMGFQRIASLPTLKSARWCAISAILPTNILLFVSCTTGVVAFSYFKQVGCDPFSAGKISNENKIIPYFVKEILNYPGVPGIFTAGLACGTLSNLSSVYNSCAALFWQDILKERLRHKHLSEHRKTFIIKCLAFGAGVLTTSFGFLVANFKGTVIQMSTTINGFVVGPMFICITAGALTTKTTWKSVAVGSLVSVIFINCIGFENNRVSVKSHDIRDGLVTNCTWEYQPVSTLLDNTTIAHTTHMSTDQYHYTSGFDVITMNDTDTKKTKDDVFVLYRMSYLLLLPLTTVSGLVVTLFFSYIPGFRNSQEVESKLLFPFVRRFCGMSTDSKDDDQNGIECEAMVNSSSKA